MCCTGRGWSEHSLTWSYGLRSFHSENTLQNCAVQYTPTEVLELEVVVKSIHAGDRHVLLIDQRGALYAMGSPMHGKLGHSQNLLAELHALSRRPGPWPPRKSRPSGQASKRRLLNETIVTSQNSKSVLRKELGKDPTRKQTACSSSHFGDGQCSEPILLTYLRTYFFIYGSVAL